MGKIDYSKVFIKEACPTMIGGQAVMEGIMMQGPDRRALAMRIPSGELFLKTKKKGKPSKWSKIPVVRGVAAFVNSLVAGTSTLMESADILEQYAPEIYNEEPGKLEAWVNKKFGKKAAWNMMLMGSVILAILLAVGIFVILPTWVVSFVGKWIENAIVLNLIEGIIRIAMFVVYVVAISRMEEIKTVFRYHGAEHKSIHCFESGMELTPDNAQGFYTLHPRCGTSFLVFVLIISLLLFSLMGWPNLLWRILSRLLLIPVVAGLSYELLKFAARSSGKLVQILSLPGLMLQKLTTAEPTLDQLEVGLMALKAVLVDPDTPEITGFVDSDANLIKDDLWAEDSAVMKNKLPKDEDSFPDENAVKEAIRFLSEIDEDGYTIVGPEECDASSIAKAIADHFGEEAKARSMARRYTDDISTIENALKWGQASLGMLPNGRNEAHMIMSYATGLSRAELITRGMELMEEEDFKVYEEKIYARLDGTPLQYLVGMTEFMGLPLRVNPSVLIPRLDTEAVVEEAIKLLEERNLAYPDVLDMCTGSGAIGISVAAKVPNSYVTMSDVSEKALDTARANAELNKVAARCVFLEGNMFDAIPESKSFDMIISNPPYIESAVIDTLDIEVRKHEPRLALDGGVDGLDYYRIIAENASMHIKSGGNLVLEIGANQAINVMYLLNKAGTYKNIRMVQDLAGLDRVIIAERR